MELHLILLKRAFETQETNGNETRDFEDFYSTVNPQKDHLNVAVDIYFNPLIFSSCKDKEGSVSKLAVSILSSFLARGGTYISSFQRE